ncbi:chorismate-binding protein [Flagellimonas sp. 2504JD1-5]
MPKNKPFPDLIKAVSWGIDQKFPFAVYRKPKEEQVVGIFQSDNRLNVIKDFSERGFVFAPFDTAENTVLIRPDEVYVSKIISMATSPDSEIELLDEGKEIHLKLVEAGIKAIKNGGLKKVVLSRTMEADCSSNPEEIFTRLLNTYRNAFCYLFYHPKIGMWCGATPETLVHIKERELRTMSLAATLPINESKLPDWGSKEIVEQQMVSDYIQKRLANKLDALHIGPAESIKAGNLWHLKSEITGAIGPKTNLKEIVQALHPTPAVCGIPVEVAKKFISNHENYKRSFYTGFLGELNLWNQNEISLFVNLRCMALHEQKALIFVGGGITSASDPEREWVETQNKSKTMLNIL